MFDLSVAKEELFLRTSIQTNAGTAVTIQSDLCPANELWQPTFISVHNKTGEAVKVQFCLVRVNDTLLIAADQTPGDGTAVGTNILPLVGPGERIGAVLTGTANKAVCWLVVTGWKFYERKEPKIA